MELIREYNKADERKLLELLDLNTPKYFHPSEKEDFQNYLNNEVEDYYVLEYNNEIVGCGGINYFINNNEARISWDVIHPDYQGKGFGIRLLRYRLDKISCYQGINLIVVRTTQCAFQFYEKVGFNIVKFEKDFWVDGFDLYQMELSIAKL